MIDLDFDEVNESQFPAVELLIKLGWKYLSREEADKARNGDRRKVILTNIAKDALMRINDYDGKKFDEPDIAGKVDELENTEFNGLIDTCREISGRIMPKLGGGTIKVFENGAYQDRSIRVLTVVSCPAYRFLRRQIMWPGFPISLIIFHSLL